MNRRDVEREDRRLGCISLLSVFASPRPRFTVSLFLIFFILLFAHFSPVNASSPQKELKEIQKRLSREKIKVKRAIKQERSILSEIEETNRILKKKREELSRYDRRLSETRSKIRLLDNEIELFERKLEKRKGFLRDRLLSLYKQQRQGDVALILISARDNQDLIKRMNYISSIAYYDSRLMKTYDNEIKELSIKMKHMEILQRELQVNKSNVRKKTEEMEAQRKKKDILLASVINKRSSYEKMVKELEDSSTRLRNMIKQLDMDQEYLPVSGKGFGRLMGKLPWPIKGKILVPFGKQKDPEFNITTFRKGIEIKAGIGDTVLSVAGGRVVYADWFKGYGLLLIINHGNGFHTLYAHLSEIFHDTGDIIKRRQAVGRIGESGVMNVPSLYFEIRHKGKPSNPLRWLRKKGK